MSKNPNAQTVTLLMDQNGSFSFSPNTITVKKKNTEIVVNLSYPGERFRIVGFTTLNQTKNAASQQFSGTINNSGTELTITDQDTNTQEQTYNLTVLVQDSQSNPPFQIIPCDPQVRNEVDPD